LEKHEKFTVAGFTVGKASKPLIVMNKINMQEQPFVGLPNTAGSTNLVMRPQPLNR
jgi:hypothetical protein